MNPKTIEVASVVLLGVGTAVVSIWRVAAHLNRYLRYGATLKT